MEATNSSLYGRITFYMLMCACICVCICFQSDDSVPKLCLINCATSARSQKYAVESTQFQFQLRQLENKEHFKSNNWE